MTPKVGGGRNSQWGSRGVKEFSSVWLGDPCIHSTVGAFEDSEDGRNEFRKHFKIRLRTYTSKL